MSAWGKDYDEPFDPGPTDEDTITPTWDRLDLTTILDGTFTPQLPEYMPRTDGPALIYPGRVHSFHGESESGKSMAIQAEAARVITLGQDVLYIDFESDADTVVGRLLEMGVTPELIGKHFDYRRPEINPQNASHELRAFYLMLEQTYALAVIDGVTEALHVFGAATKDNDELTGWIRAVPKAIARHTGAAVVLIDHVTKDADTRGRFAIGGQAKMAALDGAAYVVEVAEPLGRGLRGVTILRVAKDRPGSVRPHAGTFRKTDRTQEAARVVIDSRSAGRIQVTVEPPATALDGPDGTPAPFRPTALMERVSTSLELHQEPISTSRLLAGVTGNEKATTVALEILVAERFVKRTSGPRNANMYQSVRSYRQTEDELSDRFRGSNSPPPDLRLTSASAGGEMSESSSATVVRSIDGAEVEEDIQPWPAQLKIDDLRHRCPECQYKGFHASYCPNNPLDPDQEPA